jgi:nitrite reductase/ring-hydroxylating ferredoxin subunit
MELDRRRALCGLAGAGFIAAALAACGDGDDTSGSGDSENNVTATTTDGATILSATSEIPVAGGVVVTLASGAPVAVVQPVEGTFKAFSAVCTHQGTTIGAAKDGQMVCPNHGSTFSAEDGTVLKGPNGQPASSITPLASIAVRVEGGNVLLAA